MTAELPPRPEPPKRLGDTLNAWLAWFGVARLIVSALCVVIVAMGVAWLVRAPAPSTEAGLAFTSGSTAVGAPSMPTLPTPPTVPPTTRVPDDRPVLVHVAGSVVSPGVYALDPDGRIQGAIDAAGGPTPSADLDGVNLASPVADGQRIYVPEVGEVDPSTVPSGGAAVGDGGTGVTIAVGPIDLNTATAAQLESLPGVGPATAAAIVDDRDRHGPFATVADLERVPGIGPAKLAAIAERVTV